jgi:hypothetical protein
MYEVTASKAGEARICFVLACGGRHASGSFGQFTHFREPRKSDGPVSRR